MTPAEILHRAWQVRPGALETPVAVIAVCLGDLLFGIPAVVSGAGLAALGVVIALLTAVSELREERAKGPAPEEPADD